MVKRLFTKTFLLILRFHISHSHMVKTNMKVSLAVEPILLNRIAVPLPSGDSSICTECGGTLLQTLIHWAQSRDRVRNWISNTMASHYGILIANFSVTGSAVKK